MNVNVQGLRRNVKNVVRNYSEAQVKVREATSNDPWGPPSSLMSEIADLSYNVVAFSEIMQMIWKRLNDHGKNWRHVYKALVLLEYLIKTGSEKVAQQCRENIFAIQTLKDFQYMEDNKDQGMNVREKSKQLVALLKDEERYRTERARALKAKERYAQATGRYPGPRRDSYNSDLTSPRGDGFVPSQSELESARPQTAGEEELQLQLALAMSKEEADQDERQRRNDDLRLQMAINESKHEIEQKMQHQQGPSHNGASGSSPSALDELLGLNLGPPAGGATAADPWGLPSGSSASGLNPSNDPWAPATGGAAGDPWSPSSGAPKPPLDPWSPLGATASPTPLAGATAADPWQAIAPTNGTSATNGATARPDDDDFDLLSRRSAGASPLGDPYDLSGMKTSLSATNVTEKQRKTPESFLGPNKNLVNLDALVTSNTGRSPSAADSLTSPTPSATSLVAAPSVLNPFVSTTPSSVVVPAATANPFGSATSAVPSNPFQAAKPPAPTINQLRNQTGGAPPFPPAPPAVPPFPSTTAAPGLLSSAFAPLPQANPFM